MLLRCNYVHSIFCSCHCDIEQTTLLCIINRFIVFNYVLHHGIVIDFRWKSIHFVPCIDYNDIVITQSFRTMCS